MLMHGSIPPVTLPPRATPGTILALPARGWGIVLSGLCPGGRGGANRKRTEKMNRDDKEKDRRFHWEIGADDVAPKILRVHLRSC